MRPLLVLSAAMSAMVHGSSASALTVGTTGDPAVLASTMQSSGNAITITGAIYSGSNQAAATYAEGPLGIANGILLTTGQAHLALPPSDDGSTGASNGLPGDPLCDALIPGFKSFDATKLTITFDLAPGFDGISFQSIFGSEEYPEYVGSMYNDVYAVYLDGEQIVFDAQGNSITINGPFFSSGAVVVAPETETEYDGSTGLLTTRAPLAGGTTGHVLEIVICDAGDQVLDSGVFLAGLNGCVGNDCSGTVPCHMIDNDGDGTSSCDDCDDTSADVYPGAAEACNEVDDDCDGEVDEDAVCCGDDDGDGICGGDDMCSGTVLPESVPTVALGANRWADTNGDGVFETTSPSGNAPETSYTMTETGGCSCAQIIEALGLGDGHTKFGCSISAMDTWVSLVP
ncbi:choice-of-anchor L domain-containing protein [Polyangium jinanense]|uniref:Metal-binding motif-containing protein n=1 Tax=Polyangium jinanense TaxID=2829994 RepID=A0A9X4AQE1_9BACT|nr:choice-of-anchor L domain-containing protein [Polyangium jinanense]MDC3952637.1 putative metal-binding motif-containing protein [Polyangium jinanense]MDC3980256.1 putative metal-binding motif-containing protein [Polyangium jinanense]